VVPVLSSGEIEQVLSLGHEIRGFELKAPGPSTVDRHLLAKVARAALSLGNLRDAGLELHTVSLSLFVNWLTGPVGARLTDSEPGGTFRRKRPALIPAGQQRLNCLRVIVSPEPVGSG
jgi:hypothetical protein